LYVFYKFLGEPVMINPQFHQCNPSIIFCRWNDAKRRYPDWILTCRKFTKLVLSTTSSTLKVKITASSTLMSVGTPTEGKLGLVREKRGGREVGIIAIAYPDLL
jgi:hypothetical protein